MPQPPPPLSLCLHPRFVVIPHSVQASCTLLEMSVYVCVCVSLTLSLSAGLGYNDILPERPSLTASILHLLPRFVFLCITQNYPLYDTYTGIHLPNSTWLGTHKLWWITAPWTNLCSRVRRIRKLHFPSSGKRAIPLSRLPLLTLGFVVRVVLLGSILLLLKVLFG